MILYTNFTNYLNRTRKDRKRRLFLEKSENEINARHWVSLQLRLKKFALITDANKVRGYTSNKRKLTRKILRKLNFHLFKKRTYRKLYLSHTKVSARCVFTDSARSVNSEFRLSRMTFKELADSRHLTGVTHRAL